MTVKPEAPPALIFVGDEHVRVVSEVVPQKNILPSIFSSVLAGGPRQRRTSHMLPLQKRGK